MGKFRWWKCSLRHCSVLDENRLKRRKKKQCGCNYFFQTYIDERWQLHHHHGLAGLRFRPYCHCQDLGVNHRRGTAETRTITRTKAKKKCYFLRTGVHTWVKLEFFLWDSVKWWGKIRGLCRRASFDIPHTRLRSGCMIISAHQRSQHEINLSGQQMTL